jgi:hypothetical protein
MTSEKREQFSCLVPFAGFYYSVHDKHIDYCEEVLMQDIDGEVNSKLYEMFWDDIDYREVHSKYAARFTEWLSHYLGVRLEFEEMRSPRFYNFETDRIFAKLSRADFCKLLKKVRGARLKKMAEDMFTSRSGFISFYSNKVEEWGRIDAWDHNHCGAVLAAAVRLFEQEGCQEFLNLLSCNIDEVIAEDITYEEVEEWLIGAAGEKAIRALNINDYLRRREERRYYRKPSPAAA